MITQENIRVAIVQHGPEYLNAAKSVEKACDLLSQAAQDNAGLVVFGETWLSGYPAWLDHCNDVALWDHPGAKEAYWAFYKNAITVPGPEVEALTAVARDKAITLCIGVNERVEKGPGNGTVYNSLLIIGPNGQLLTHHRKLMPTYTEKLLYGVGDGHGLGAVETPQAKVGGLICWEHWMPLARMAMHDSGEHLHVALWPTVHEMHQVASRQYAFEGRCYVLAAGQMLRAKELPQGFSLNEGITPETLLLRGGSAIIGPNGQYVAGPVYEEDTIVTADLDMTQVYKERMTLDVTGHYQRNDVFTWQVNRERKG